jgi:hypothetical protein
VTLAKSITLFCGIQVAFSFAQAQGFARFSGGMCVSQGNWLQAALQQSDVLSNAITVLKDDPNCQVLIDTVSKLPKVENGARDEEEASSFASTHKELAAIASYLSSERLRPMLTSANSAVAPQDANGASQIMTEQAFRDIVFQVVFNRSFSHIKEIRKGSELSILNSNQRELVADISGRLKSFLNRSAQVTNASMDMATRVLNVLPQSEKCLHNKPSTAAAIFGGIAHTITALTTGGKINGTGELIGALMKYNREMSYVNALVPLERERFNASVSCLLESTAEAYCSIQDAEDSLNYFKELNLSKMQVERLNQVIKNADKDPVANPLGGLVILMRDVPTLQLWMQRLLFGIDPKLSVEAQMKNKYWESYVSFIQSINKLQADYRDMEALYLQNGGSKDIQSRLGQVKKILGQIINNMDTREGMSSQINFFERIFPSSEAMPFALMGMQIPADFNAQVNTLDTMWLKWTNDGTNGFNDPDLLLRKIKDNLWLAMEKAQSEANAFFASRMVVDPHNLIAESMRGPGVSPYQALINLRNYFKNLMVKLEISAKKMEDDELQSVRREQILVQLPMFKDTIKQLTRVIEAIKAAKNFNINLDLKLDVVKEKDPSSSEQSNQASQNKISEEEAMSTKILSQQIMSDIYDASQMMLARDSFFGVRMATALQADISDTLWRDDGLTPRQAEYFLSVGPQIINALSGYFTTNPVVQRADVNQAKMIHIENLKSSELLFAKVLFNKLVDLNCKTEGGAICNYQSLNRDPVELNDKPGLLAAFNDQIIKSRQDKAGQLTGGYYYKLLNYFKKPTEDSEAHLQLKAKLCVQALAFESRNAFSELCRGAVLKSDFADEKDSFKLHTSFDAELEKINNISKAVASSSPTSAAGASVAGSSAAGNKAGGTSAPGASVSKSKIDASRNLGVCSLRSYLRKNHIFYIYREFQQLQK